MDIHPTAVIDPSAELGEGVKVGPCAVINGEVVIGAQTEIMAHAFIDRYTRLGRGCRVFPGASVGTIPQDLKFGGEKSEVVIGDGVTIREFVTVNRGTAQEGGRTVIGDESVLMAYVHVAHDCQIGRKVILVNNLAMAGHVVIEDEVTVAGMVGIHQFVRIGTQAFIGGFSRVIQDVPPYMLGQGADEFKLHGPNTIGLRRRGFPRETITALKEAFRLIFRNHRPLQEALDEAVAQFPDVAEVKRLVEFIRNSPRGVHR